MSKTITMRLDDDVYQTFRTLAERDNRPLSNFIETAAMRFISDNETVDSYEMAEIRGNAALNASLKRGVKDAKTRRGSFV
jgi:predicted transcriptional regulator